jgi:hypothetical protein
LCAKTLSAVAIDFQTTSAVPSISHGATLALKLTPEVKLVRGKLALPIDADRR